MRLVEVEKIPDKHKINILSYLEEFERMSAKMVEIVGAADHYSNLHVGYVSWCNAIRRYGYRMNVAIRDDKLYLTKLD